MFGLNFQEIISAIKPKGVIKDKNPPKIIKGISLDTRIFEKEEGFLALKGKNFDGHNFLTQAQEKGASFLIVDKIPSKTEGVIRIPVLVVENTTKALGLLAKALRRKYSPLVFAVTGSLGKTTAKDMIFFILKNDFFLIKNKASENNQIGLPKTLFGLKRSRAFCVLELGTNHFGEIAYLASLCKPDVGIVTCIDNVHLEFFKNKEGVFEEKTAIFKVCPGALPILKGDDEFLRGLRTKVNPLYFGKDKKFPIYFKFKKRDRESLLFLINSKYLLRLNTPGYFNIYNALAALSCGVYVGKPLRDSVEVLSDFTFPEMRLQLKTLGGFRFLNDACNSNPTALRKGLEALSKIPAKRKIAVLADMLELGHKSLYFHRKIAGPISEAGFSHIIFLGELTKATAAALVKKGFSKENIFLADDIQSARKHLFGIIEKNDLIFLKGSRKFRLERMMKLF
ncbi:MAG: UDP-N-acetylmuramoyl-tripeptide--D-alanyl-D-alanine ligase [Candidatus Omnitrophica bacterium]|nr:UDP-N-acetylmuramoyl-tripeptide--D-alanyl-D-alanine ligase [Candidatus Omnitrophota bacterium]